MHGCQRLSSRRCLPSRSASTLPLILLTYQLKWPPSERVAYQADLVACVSWLDDAIRLHLDTLLAAGQEGEDDWLWNNYAQVIKKLEDNRTLRGEGDYGVGAPEEVCLVLLSQIRYRLTFGVLRTSLK
jgi:hypothetical protein